MRFGYLVFTHFSGKCISSQGKAAKPVGTYTFNLEEMDISLRGRPGWLSCTTGVQGAGGEGQIHSATWIHKRTDLGFKYPPQLQPHKGPLFWKGCPSWKVWPRWEQSPTPTFAPFPFAAA